MSTNQKPIYLLTPNGRWLNPDEAEDYLKVFTCYSRQSLQEVVTIESYKALEEKLAKAIKTLEFYSKPHENDGAYVGNICYDRVQGNDCEVIGAFSIAGRLARQTLAEIKEDK